MVIRLYALFLCLAIWVTTAAPEQADHCACCAGTVTWERIRQPLDAGQRSEVSRIPSFDGFLEGLDSATRIEVDFLGENDNRTGLVTDRVSVFKPDWRKPAEFFHTYTGKPLPSPNVDLYKELAINGTLELSGQLAAALGVEQVEATLVLKGQGDHCFKLRDYWYWLLKFTVTVDGASAEFGAAGELVKL